MKVHYLKKVIVLLLILSSASFIKAQSVTIGSCGTTGSTNATLDLNSGGNRNTGIVIPHVALSATLTTFSPPMAGSATTKDTGLMVYNTNAALPDGAGYYCWNGSIWVYVGGGQSIVAPAHAVVVNNGGTATGSSNFTWGKITSGLLSGDTALTGANGFLDFNNYDYDGYYDKGLTLGNSGGVLSLQQSGGNLMFQSFGNGDLFEMGNGIDYSNASGDELITNNEFKYKNDHNGDYFKIDDGMDFWDGAGNWIQTDSYAGGGIYILGQDGSGLWLDDELCGTGFWFGVSGGTQFNVQNFGIEATDPNDDYFSMDNGFYFSDPSSDNVTIGGYYEGVRLTGQDGSSIYVDDGSGTGIDLSSSTGVRMPSLTTSDITSISSPPAGTIVWNSTTNRFNIYNGSSWQYFSGTNGN